jgi:hypothetical protein
MNQNIVYVGLDVDDTEYHGSAVDKTTGEILHFKCRLTLKGLLNQLQTLGKHFRGRSFRVCYEASYIGYTRRAGYCGGLATLAKWSPRQVSLALAAGKSKPIVSMRHSSRNFMPMAC